MFQSGNLFQNIPVQLDDESFEVLLRGRSFRAERIVSRGQKSPEGFWYQQVEAEWVMVLQGAARLLFEDGTLKSLRPGDYLLTPPGVRHRVDWTDPTVPTVWLAIHFPPET